jgi:uncharacterized protein (TIRG00374 family)
VVRRREDDERDERRVRGRERPGERRAARRGDAGGGDHGIGQVDARHGRDRVVEVGDEPCFEVDAADVGDRVHEVVERPRRSDWKEEENRLRAERRQDGGTTQATEVGIAAAEEPDQPSDRQADVERHVSDVQDRDEAATWEKKGLEVGLDVESEAPLEGDDSLRVRSRLPPALLVHDEPPHQQVRGIDAETDRDLPASREGPRPVTLSHGRGHTYPPMRTPWRRYIFRVALGSAATGAFLWLFLREVDLGEAWHEIRALPGWTLLAAVGLILVNVFFMTLRWKYLLSGAGYTIRKRKLFSTISVGRGANNFLPARGGDLLRIESIREQHVPVFVIAGTLFAERLLDGVVLSIWILLGALLLGEGGPILLTGIALSAGTALGVSLVGLAARDHERTEGFIWRATKWLPPRWHTRAARAAAHFVEGLGAFRGRKRTSLVFATSAGMWLADVAMFYIVGQAFDIDIGVGGFFLLEGVGNLALAVPATAAGIGTFDYLTLVAAKGIDIPTDKATAYVLTMHALTVLPITLLGAVLLRPAFPRMFRRREQAPAEEAG